MVASDVAGFIASALVLMTFAMRDMRLLRITAIFSNVAVGNVQPIHGSSRHQPDSFIDIHSPQFSGNRNKCR